jgi:hypothetical protein
MLQKDGGGGVDAVSKERETGFFFLFFSSKEKKNRKLFSFLSVGIANGSQQRRRLDYQICNM